MKRYAVFQLAQPHNNPQIIMGENCTLVWVTDQVFYSEQEAELFINNIHGHYGQDFLIIPTYKK